MSQLYRDNPMNRLAIVVQGQIASQDAGVAALSAEHQQLTERTNRLGESCKREFRGRTYGRGFIGPDQMRLCEDIQFASRSGPLAYTRLHDGFDNDVWQQRVSPEFIQWIDRNLPPILAAYRDLAARQEAAVRARDAELAAILAKGKYTLSNIRMQFRNPQTRAVACRARIDLVTERGSASAETNYTVERSSDGLYVTVTPPI